MIGIKTGFVENYIEREIEKVWDSYLSVDVSSMTGYEKVPKLLTELLNKTTPFLALTDFFDQYTEREVYLTEDVLSFNDDYNASTILRIINSKDILVHIRVRLESIDRVKNFFEDELEKNLNQLWMLLY